MNNSKQEELENLKDFYKDFFADDVKESLNHLIDEEIGQQKEIIKEYKKEILGSNIFAKIYFSDLENLITRKLAY
ncbi:hypothetical protein [Tenacibaculum finnmarkense]|uniref:hypothetical protein n=1 Tax=Tenacibaculum finnmarkense TaxID=2781243 RepID=UPI000C3BF9E9|nr:hypothetical protein [Tenacibaculum finnmarkense]MCD8439999.1 hypothetical protein [Tenacibaculum finnmarkense genomovar ulcerans]MCG8721079.1 hypothetical protein [Tenacibaculum finnmarkense]SOS55002.1 conserved hypothetical protein [Tenacibaculum finnmarkense]